MKHERYAPHKGHADAKMGGNKGVAPKTASPGAGACDGGGSAEIAKSASALNRGNAKGGLPGL